MKRHFVPLGEIAEIMGGYAFKSSMMSSEPKEFQIIKMSNLYQGSLDLGRNPSFWESIDAKTERYLLQSDDILMTLTGTVGKRDYGYTVQLRDEEKLLLNQRVCRIRPMHKKVDGFYLFQYLRTQEFLNKFFDCSIGGTGNQSNVGISDLRELDIFLPTISDQKAIADLLSTWDEAIEKTERLIQAKEKGLNALYQSYFRADNATAKKWELIKVGRFLTPRNERAVPSDQQPLYSLTIENGVTEKTKRYNREFLVKDTGNKTYKVVHPGDIVFNPANLRWGAIARSEAAHTVVLSPIYEVLQIKEGAIDPDFLTHALTCPRQIAIYATKTEGTLIERMAVKLDVFLLLKIRVPCSLSEQKEIAKTFDAVKHEIDLLKQLADKYKTQKRGLMQKMLTGEWRVKPEIVNQYMEA